VGLTPLSGYASMHGQTGLVSQRTNKTGDGRGETSSRAV